jgi:hypothetical protein
MKKIYGKEEKGFLSLRQVGEILGLTRQGVLYHVEDGDLPVRYIDKFYVVKKEDFEKFKAEREKRGLEDSRIKL